MKRSIARRLLVLTFTSLLLLTPNRLDAGKPVFVGQQRSKAIGMHEIDHSDWNALLQKYVDDDGFVNYRSWNANAGDRKTLDSYLDHLSTASTKSNPKTAAEHRLAFWINAYNAVTVKGILREYPTTSIRNHTAKLWGYNIWKDLQLYVGGKPYSLDQMEHEILRKMSEPRIHFAIVCASKGCPRLLNEAYQADRLDEQLDVNAKDFFSRRQNFRYDARAKRFYLSSILSWFGEDFGSSRSNQLRTIANWLPDTTSRSAAQDASASVSFLDYDWSLNEQK